ncbi:MAG: cysteine protease [Methylobacter sp.]|nr:MAG: cysteine protease [Methylobacter sp.]
MPPFFQKKIDRRSRTAMVAFLTGHFRYDTMRSWNRTSSYAHSIKLHRLGLTSKQSDNAFEMLDTDFWDEIREPIDDFTVSQDSRYTIGVNGRSGGYLVLYESRRELTGHLSYCPACGQRNFTKVPPTFEDANEQVIAREILGSQNAWHPGIYLTQASIAALPLADNEKLVLINRIKSQLANCSGSAACGVCRNPRRNFTVPPSKLSVYPGKGIDQGESFDGEEWSMVSLRDRVDLVCAFDAACDAIRNNFLALLEDYRVVEVTEYRPVQVKQLVAA